MGLAGSALLAAVLAGGAPAGPTAEGGASRIAAGDAALVRLDLARALTDEATLSTDKAQQERLRAEAEEDGRRAVSVEPRRCRW